jgi:NitT/TauT family transport system permease protein
MKRAAAALLPLVGPLLVMVAWQLAVARDATMARFLPSPVATWHEAMILLSSAAFGADVAATLGRWAAGFTLAVVIGAPIGLILGTSETLGRASSILVDFFRSLPVTAAFPIFLVFLGVGDAAMIAMVCFATVFIQVMYATYGVRMAPPARRIMARSFGAKPLQVFFYVRAVEAAAQVVIGMRTTLSLSLIVAIVSEMFIGANRGMGQRLYLSYQLQSLAELYAIVLMVGLLGYTANLLFSRIERRFAF